jgi:hypothetical protein
MLTEMCIILEGPKLPCTSKKPVLAAYTFIFLHLYRQSSAIWRHQRLPINGKNVYKARRNAKEKLSLEDVNGTCKILGACHPECSQLFVDLCCIYLLSNLIKHHSREWRLPFECLT